VDLYSTLDNK